MPRPPARVKWFVDPDRPSTITGRLDGVGHPAHFPAATVIQALALRGRP
jgi:hypothetical protein